MHSHASSIMHAHCGPRSGTFNAHRCAYSPALWRRYFTIRRSIIQSRKMQIHILICTTRVFQTFSRPTKTNKNKKKKKRNINLAKSESWCAFQQPSTSVVGCEREFAAWARAFVSVSVTIMGLCCALVPSFCLRVYSMIVSHQHIARVRVRVSVGTFAHRLYWLKNAMMSRLFTVIRYDPNRRC